MLYPTILLLLLAPLALSISLTPRSDTTLSAKTSINVSRNPLFLFSRAVTCGTGKKVCGTGCITDVATNTCCGAYYCDSGRGCDTDGACTCLATEKKCGTGCIPSAGICCPDFGYCNTGYYCSPVRGWCCKNGEDPAACASRQGFTLPASLSTSPATSTSVIKPSTSTTPVLVVVSTTSTKPSTTTTSAVIPFTSSTTSTNIFVPASTTTTSSSSSTPTADKTTTSADVVIFTVTGSTSSASTTFAAVKSGLAHRDAVGAVGWVGVVGLLAVL